MSRVIDNAFKNIRRTPYQALAAVAVLTVTFLVGHLFALLSLASQVVLTYFETRPQVTVFFKEDASASAILAFQQQLQADPEIAAVTYVSKEDALQIYREQNSDDPLLLEMVTAEILPASLEVSAKNVEALPNIKAKLDLAPDKEEVAYQQDVVEAVKKWTNGIRWGGLVLLIILGTTSLFVTTMVISMKVSAKRKEISIMQLLGARPWFIRGPFVVEGMIYGMTSAFVAWGVVYIALLYTTPMLLTFFGEIPLLPVSPISMLLVLSGALGAGLVVGLFSGLTSSRRYS